MNRIESKPRWPFGGRAGRVTALGRQRRRRSAAFTLLELMLAIMIFAMVLTAVYSTWLAILKGTQVSLKAAAGVQRSRIAMRALEDALNTAQLFYANIGYYAFVAEEDNMSMVSRLPASFPGVGMYGDQIVRRVRFYLEPGKDGLDELMMSQAPLLIDTENGDVEPYTIALAKGVSVFNLQFWDRQQNDWVDEWIQTNSLPKLVQITLGLGQVAGSSSRPQDVVARIVALPATAVTPDIQSAPAMGPPGLNNQFGTNMPGFDPRRLRNPQQPGFRK